MNGKKKKKVRIWLPALKSLSKRENLESLYSSSARVRASSDPGLPSWEREQLARKMKK